VMNDVAIRVENIGKRYRISGPSAAYDTLRDTIAGVVRTPFHALRQRGSRRGTEEFWALRDISFDVKQGEVLGIIGRNGAGKSTLLKILSRVTRPSTGRADVCGRIGSLLEVGTGFHPELSGRENIYLNAAILGMKRDEVRRKFDVIVDFADIGPFLDTPVKRYSSGMYMRLAFSIAAHLEPEILIVDEVLAVGDAAFQEKCLGKMRGISKSDGRTILFVSHNMDAIQHLCSRCIFLDHGYIAAAGDCRTTIARYLSIAREQARPDEWIDISSNTGRSGTGAARFVAIQYRSDLHSVGFHPYPGGPLDITLAVESDAARSVGSLAVTITDQSGTKLINADTVLRGLNVDLQRGLNLVKLRIQEVNLNPGVYRLGLWLADPIRVHFADPPFDCMESAFEFEIVNVEAGGNGLDPDAVVPCEFELLPSGRVARFPDPSRVAAARHGIE
jgi:lipopolysaccharide transport system ATP-binding protein